MRKILLLAVFMAFSCSSDDDRKLADPKFNVDLLLKGWAYDQVIIDGFEYEYIHNQACYKNHFGFRNREGQEFQFEEVIFEGEVCSIISTNLRWEPDGDYINLYFGSYPLGRLKILELTPTMLHGVLEIDFDNDGTRDQQEIKAIPYDPYNSF